MFLRGLNIGDIGNIPALQPGPKGGVMVGNTELPPDTYLATYFKGKGGYWGEVWQKHGRIGTLMPGGSSGIFRKDTGPGMVDIIWPTPEATPAPPPVVAAPAPAPAPVSTLPAPIAVAPQAQKTPAPAPSAPVLVPSGGGGGGGATTTTADLDAWLKKYQQTVQTLQPLAPTDPGAPPAIAPGVTAEGDAAPAMRPEMWIAGGAAAIAAYLFLKRKKR
jgi:hypothetical protein